MSTRSIIIIGALIVVVLGAAGFGLAFAVSHMNAGSASVTLTPTTAPTVVATTPTKNKKGNKKYPGIIQSLGTNSFVLMETGKKAKSITVMVDDQTKYSGPNGRISFSDLQVGENVTVKGTLDNQNQTITASNVTVTSSGNATPTP
jgi:hypothetical protein